MPRTVSLTFPTGATTRFCCGASKVGKHSELRVITPNPIEFGVWQRRRQPLGETASRRLPVVLTFSVPLSRNTPAFFISHSLQSVLMAGTGQRYGVTLWLRQKPSSFRSVTSSQSMITAKWPPRKTPFSGNRFDPARSDHCTIVQSSPLDGMQQRRWTRPLFQSIRLDAFSPNYFSTVSR